MRDKIIDAALSFRGVPFLHQGRTRAGLDCVGLLVAVGQAIGIENIVDMEGYRRTPDPATMRGFLEANCQEIPLADMLPGDIYWMRMGGLKPRHTGILLPDGQMIHASQKGVRIQPLSDFPSVWFVAGFRVR